MRLINVILLLFPVLSFGQTIERDYESFVKEFCAEIVVNEELNLKESPYYFGPFSNELELELMDERCNSNDDREKCGELINNVMAKPENFNSIIYIEMRRLLFDTFYSKNSNIEIENINVLDEGYKTHVFVEVYTTESKWVVFQLNKYSDEPIYITDIYMSSGKSVFNDLLPNNQVYLRMLGVINDPDGFSNLRDARSSSSNIIKKILLNELFYYTPDINSNWWNVTSLNDCSNGYIHKSRIKSVLKVEPNEELQNKINKITSTSRIRCQ